MRIAVTALLLAVTTVVTVISITTQPYYENKSGDELRFIVGITALLWLLFTLSFLALRRVPLKAAVVLVIAGSVAIGGASMAGPPNTSTDSARYAWDGIVQNAGISPYAYVPADPALEHLRTDWLFPAATIDADGDPRCVGERVMRAVDADTGEVTCTTINRPTVPTIYPPTSELLFAGVRFVTGPEPQYWPMQLVGLLMSLGITGVLLRALHTRGKDPRWAALWGWSPLAATEAVTNSHIDVLSAVLVLAATFAVAAGHRWRGGIALGAAIAVKLVPVIAAPALLRRQPYKVIVASIATFLLLYVPYVLTTGIAVLGYLPGYISEEGYSSGDRFVLLSAFLPGVAATVLAIVILGVTAGLVWWKTPPTSPWLGQLVMIGVTLLVVAPRYPWYGLMLVPFIAMTGRWEWFAVPLALTARLLIPTTEVAQVAIAVAVAIVVAASVHRAGPGALPRLGRWLRHPLRAPEAISMR
ncbi:glycosyltransferase family 87 protein [Marisediminicola senii]|uniref:glycosyltransferase family 87 protein n=1 Tax=Marisediminicola senii TaxID=2711233 RepID=UPI0013EC91DC|nr:glycosyltransferase family 87 protein [Marisediminicola senii]